jgi:ribosome-associated protein
MADVRVNDAVVIPAAEIATEVFRSAGPGGQHVNKTDSAVRIRWMPGGSRAFAGLSDETRAWVLSRLAGRLTLGGELLVVSRLTRDQNKNRSDALDKLAGIVRAALARPKKRKATRPTRASKERRIGAKRRRSEIKRGRRGEE